MGKILIIKNANFSVNSIDNVELVPSTPSTDIDLGTLTDAYLKPNGQLTNNTPGAHADTWKVSDFVQIPKGKTKIIGHYYSPQTNQVKETVAYILFYNNGSVLSNYKATTTIDSASDPETATDYINASIPKNATHFRMCFRAGYQGYSHYTLDELPTLQWK